MQLFPIHPLEEQRLAALKSYRILDTMEEKDFDDLTALASVICQVPIALISLLDEDRQWFKSHHGTTLSETPIDQAFCAHAIVAPEDITIIEDPKADSRFKDNPLVTGEPHIGFYAGVPLVNEDGLPLGTLCILDQQTHLLSEHQRNALKILARQVMDKLELRRKVLVLQDTARQLEEANTALTHAESVLQHTVAERTKELQRSNEDLQQFAHVASHDLKEPVRKVRLFASHLEHEAFHLLPPESQRSLEKIQRAAGRMQSMIEGVLTYSEQLGALDDGLSVDLDLLLEDVLVDLEMLIADKQAQIEVSALGVLEGSRVQLHQLFYNLLINALKFSRSNVPPRIKIQSAIIERDGRGLKQLMISDNGIGFDPVFAHQIFHTFTRLHSKDRFEGTGMGLALCRKIVQRHGGYISADGEEGQGAVFTVELPLKSMI